MNMIRLRGLFYSCVVLVGVFYASSASASVTNILNNCGGHISDPTTGDVTIDCNASNETSADPILKIFTTDGSDFTFRLDELISNNSTTSWTGWYEELLVPDGADGWMPS